jgi:hypothetical protein
MFDIDRVRRPSQLVPDWLSAVGPGWTLPLRRLHEDLTALVPDYQVTQVKEKHGSLRVHLHPLPPDASDAVSALLVAAEHVSLRICEFCGRPGRPRRRGDRPTGWVKTVCDHCQAAGRTRWTAGKAPGAA